MGVLRMAVVLLVAVLLSGCMTVAEKEAIEALPMYGQPELARSDYLKSEDAAFIKQTSFRYRGDVKQASRDWVKRADGLLHMGDTDAAMRHFNQAWLLDPENYQVYWGFGRVLVEKRQFSQAAHFLDRALAMVNDPYQKPALLTDRGTVYSLQGEQAREMASGQQTDLFAAANARFAEALALDETYLPVWQRWAQSLYRQGEYASAWEKIHQARQRGVTRFSRVFLRDLADRLPEPTH